MIRGLRGLWDRGAGGHWYRTRCCLVGHMYELREYSVMGRSSVIDTHGSGSIRDTLDSLGVIALK